MIWATRQISSAEVPSVDHLFRDQVAALGTDARMLLVAVGQDQPAIRLWVVLPDLDLLASYYGFVLCLRSDLPVAPILIGSSTAEFERVFYFPTDELRGEALALRG